MTFAENIIKLTDYPFLYSFTLIYTNVKILELDDSSLFLLLGMISIFGTILTILDPVGWMIKEWQINLKYWVSYLIRHIKWHLGKKNFVKPSRPSGKHYEKFISTHWISYEIDRNVSMIYFGIILLSLILVIAFNQQLYTSVLNPNGKIDVYYYLFLSGAILSFLFLSIKISKSVGNLNNQLRIVNTYFTITQYLDQYKEHAKEFDILKDQTSAMFTAFNNRDWGAAELLADGINRIRKKYHLPE